MTFTIREAIQSDALSINTINKESLGYDISLELTTQQLNAALNNPDHTIYVALDDNTVVGYIHFCLYTSFLAPQEYLIMELAADTRYQGQGVGRQLMNSLEHEAHLHGISLIRLCSGTHRHGAHAFYESMGYSSTKEQRIFKKELD